MKHLNNYIAEAIDKTRNILYIAIVLNDASVKTLEQLLKDTLKDLKDFNSEPKCHHMTVAYGKDVTDKYIKWAEQNETAEIEMTATRLGISDKAIAVELDTSAPCANVHKHITLAVNQDTGGKPVDSNYITGWKPINKISLRGTIKVYYKN